jgi:hypothetical protein
MPNRSTEQTVCDRRILKAFYTQYVAVLLIILVFSVGAFQRASAHTRTSVERSLVMIERPSVGSLELDVEFDSSGSVAGSAPELAAIVDVIKEHDLRARVTLATPIADEHTALREVEAVLARIEALRHYFSSRGLSESDVQLFVGGPEARSGKVSVQFEEVSHDNLPL